MAFALRSLEQQWEEFASKVFAGFEPSRVQREEMRRAFYAGTWSLLCTLKDIAHPSISEQQALEHMNSIRVDCHEFKDRLLREHGKNQ